MLQNDLIFGMQAQSTIVFTSVSIPANYFNAELNENVDMFVCLYSVCMLNMTRRGQKYFHKEQLMGY